MVGLFIHVTPEGLRDKWRQGGLGEGFGVFV
jgi:hypothetical protein